MILSKANKLDDGEVVEGVYFKDFSGEKDYHMILRSNQPIYKYDVIDPSTLKHSFNNGESWHTEDEIKEALSAKSKSCEWSDLRQHYNITYGVPTCSGLEQIFNYEWEFCPYCSGKLRMSQNN